MGRLNYINRKVEGLKLGQVVAKDLLKRIPPGSGWKAAVRDPTIELDVSGKALLDEGFLELAPALIRSIEYEGEQGKAVSMEELCLKDSKITTTCLRTLGRIISLAANDLRDLDLSDNLITITTGEDAAAWEAFLGSFSGCCMLRRIDFSGNTLGPKAFEILARVYAKEDPVDLLSLEDDDVGRDAIISIEGQEKGDASLEQQVRKMNINSDADGYLNDTGKPHTNGQAGFCHENKSLAKLDHHATQKGYLPMYASTRGIRSVPYLIFSNTSMTDTCALHLSYIVACHNMPEQLLSRVPNAKAGPPTQQLLAYDSIEGCQGIVYQPNSRLKGAGLKVLLLSELARVGNLDELVPVDGDVHFQTPMKTVDAARRTSVVEALSSPLLDQSRRRSATSTASGDHVGHATYMGLGTELDRARSRIQGDTLRDQGPQSNELWSAALKMLPVARRIRPIAGRVKQYSRNGSRGETTVTEQTLTTRTVDFPRSTPLLPTDPNQMITAVQPGRYYWKDNVVPESVATCPPPPLTLTKFTAEIEVKPERQSERRTLPYRSNFPGGLPEAVWRMITAIAAGSDSILSEVQQQSVWQRAQDKGTLSREMETLGKLESAQMWEVLKSMRCLSYEMNA